MNTELGATRDKFAGWRRWMFLVAVLLGSHAVSGWLGYRRVNSLIIPTANEPIAASLDFSFDDWATATAGADASSYLRVAEQFSQGHGVVVKVPDSDPPEYEPFYYWGPGTPVALGIWLGLTGGHTMLSVYLFVVLCQLVFGAISMATLWLFTRNTAALASVAFLSACCPPLFDWFYGYSLSSSEIVAVVPQAAMFFALAQGFLAYRAFVPGDWMRAGRRIARPTDVMDWCLSLFTRPNLIRRWRFVGVWFWFVLAGFLLGIQSLIRDSATIFGTFTLIFMTLRAVAWDRRRLALAVSAGLCLTMTATAVRYPVKQWNERRLGFALISTSSQGAIWRYGLWTKHDQQPWFVPFGIGFGEYLDPQAAVEVEQHWAENRPSKTWFSLSKLMRALWHQPLQALEFKLVRMPVLWLGAPLNFCWSLVTGWCVAGYALLAVYVLRQAVRRKYVPEILYLYALLLLCAMPLIHFEFRYTFPVWNTLILVPGLLLGTFSGRRSHSPNVRSEEAVANDEEPMLCDAAAGRLDATPIAEPVA